MLVHTLRGQPVAAISGRLRHAVTGEPLAGYTLEAQEADGGNMASGVTDDEGFFSLDWLWGAGTYSLGGAGLYEMTPVEVVFAADGEDMNGVVVSALPGGTVRGTVAYAESGLPLGNGVVTAPAYFTVEFTP